MPVDWPGPMWVDGALARLGGAPDADRVCQLTHLTGSLLAPPSWESSLIQPIPINRNDSICRERLPSAAAKTRLAGLAKLSHDGPGLSQVSRCVFLRIPAVGACGLAFTSTRSTFRSCWLMVAAIRTPARLNRTSHLRLLTGLRSAALHRHHHGCSLAGPPGSPRSKLHA